MKSYYLPGSVLPIHRWGSGSCEKLSNLLKFTQAIGSWESGRELNYVSFQNFSEQSAYIRKRRHCVGHNKGLKCTRCSPSVPGAFSVLEEAPDPSPPSWVAVPACADGLSPLWGVGGGLWALAEPWALMAVLRPLPLSADFMNHRVTVCILWGSEEGARGCYGPCFTSSFFWLLLAVTEAG